MNSFKDFMFTLLAIIMGVLFVIALANCAIALHKALHFLGPVV